MSELSQEVERVKVVNGKVVAPTVDFTAEKKALVEKIDAYKAQVIDFQNTLKLHVSEFSSELTPKLNALAEIKPVASNAAKVEQLQVASTHLGDLQNKSSVVMQGRFFGEMIPTLPKQKHDNLVKLTEDFKSAAAEFATATGAAPIDLSTRSAREASTKTVQKLVGMTGDAVEGKPGLGTVGAMALFLDKEATSLQLKEIQDLKAQEKKYSSQLEEFKASFLEKAGKTIELAKKELSTTISNDAGTTVDQLQGKANAKLGSFAGGVQQVLDAGLSLRERGSLQAALNKSFPMNLDEVLAGRGTKKNADDLTKFVAMMHAREQDIQNPEKKLNGLYDAEKKSLEASNGSNKKEKEANAGENAKRLAELAGKDLSHYLQAVSGKRSVEGYAFKTYKDATVDALNADRAFTNLALDIKGAERAGDSLRRTFLERIGFGKDKEEVAQKQAKPVKQPESKSVDTKLESKQVAEENKDREHAARQDKKDGDRRKHEEEAAAKADTRRKLDADKQRQRDLGKAEKDAEKQRLSNAQQDRVSNEKTTKPTEYNVNGWGKVKLTEADHKNAQALLDSLQILDSGFSSTKSKDKQSVTFQFKVNGEPKTKAVSLSDLKDEKVMSKLLKELLDYRKSSI